MRLVGGSNSLEGRVEICSSGSWGTICDRYGYWDSVDAGVACRQLGFAYAGKKLLKTVKHYETSIQLDTFTGAIARRNAYSYYGRGYVSIILSGARCTGTETRLIDCNFRNYRRYYCNHNHDVGAICLAAVTTNVVLQRSKQLR